MATEFQAPVVGIRGSSVFTMGLPPSGFMIPKNHRADTGMLEAVWLDDKRPPWLRD